MWAAGGCQDHSPDELAAGVLARGALVPLRQLATTFRDIGEDIAMPEAGSIVAFLVRQGGLSEVQRHWQRETSPREHPLGPDGAKVEKTWLDHVARIPPASVDVPRALKEGC